MKNEPKTNFLLLCFGMKNLLLIYRDKYNDKDAILGKSTRMKRRPKQSNIRHFLAAFYYFVL